MLKRLIPILLCFVMLVACSSSGAELLSFIDPNASAVDYNNQLIKIYSQEDEVLAYLDNNSIQSDAVWKRISDIEQALNVNIEITHEDGNDFIRYYTAQVATDSVTTDIFYRMNGNNLWYLARADALYPMTDFPDYIDINDHEKYGQPGILEAAMHNGIPYAVQPVQWPGLQGIECFFIVFNTEELASKGLTNLHEYYENKTWTWDTMKNYFDTAAPTLNESEVLLEAHGGFLLNMLFLSNGFDYITFVDGVPTFDLSPNEALNAIEFLRELNLYGDKIDIGTTTDDRWNYNTFIEGDALTVLATAQAVTTEDIAYEADFEYSIMPFPSGPDYEYGKWAQSVTRIYGLAIPVGAKDPDCAAHIISDLCEPMEEFGGSAEGLVQYYRENVFLTDLDVEIYFAVDDFVRYDYDDAGVINDYTNEIASNIEKATASELIQKNKNVAENMFIQYMQANLENYLIEKLNIQ